MNIPIEYFGTAASVVVAVSLTQKNIKRLRILNLIGACAFSIYGFMINAIPVFGLNAFISVIDIYYLIEMKKRKNYFELLVIENPGKSVYLKRFIEFYSDDIKHFFPGFSQLIEKDYEAVFVLRDVLPVSLVIYKHTECGIRILIDYAIPAYRDMKNAAYFLNKIADTIHGDNNEIFAESGSRQHNRYLEKIGFVYSEKEMLYKRA